MPSTATSTITPQHCSPHSQRSLRQHVQRRRRQYSGAPRKSTHSSLVPVLQSRAHGNGERTDRTDIVQKTEYPPLRGTLLEFRAVSQRYPRLQLAPDSPACRNREHDECTNIISAGLLPCGLPPPRPDSQRGKSTLSITKAGATRPCRISLCIKLVDMAQAQEQAQGEAAAQVGPAQRAAPVRRARAPFDPVSQRGLYPGPVLHSEVERVADVLTRYRRCSTRSSSACGPSPTWLRKWTASEMCECRASQRQYTERTKGRGSYSTGSPPTTSTRAS